MDWVELRRRVSAALTLHHDRPLESANARVILDARARALAQVVDRPSGESESIEVVTFSIEDQRCALETRFVCGVLRRPAYTPVSGLAVYYLGVCNIQGEIVAVVDLAPVLGTGAVQPERPWVLLIGQADVQFAVTADVVHEVAGLGRGEILTPASDRYHAGANLIAGVTREALAVLDGDALLRDDRLFANEVGE